jgi:hypothetical protein
VEKKEPLLKGWWGFIDGKNYQVQKPTDIDLQNAMYNGMIIINFINFIKDFLIYNIIL